MTASDKWGAEPQSDLERALSVAASGQCSDPQWLNRIATERQAGHTLTQSNDNH